MRSDVMPEATDKTAVTDEHVQRVVAWMFRPLVEAIEGANGGAAYWQSRYDDAARRLLVVEAEREAIWRDLADAAMVMWVAEKPSFRAVADAAVKRIQAVCEARRIAEAERDAAREEAAKLRDALKAGQVKS